MTATALTDRELRILPIAANLLPMEIVESRRSRKVRRLVLSALAGFVAVLAGWYVTASYQTSVAQDNVSNAENEAQALVRQQRTFADLVNTQAQEKAISAQLSELFATDLQWSQLLAQVQAAAPAGVKISSVSGLVGEAGKAPSATSVPVAPGSPVGTITVSGAGPSKGAVAAYLDALGRVPGLADPLLQSATEQDNKVQFTARVAITRAALGGRYGPKSGKGTGGG
jgi:Tfp pilus assembly protein PilN